MNKQSIITILFTVLMSMIGTNVLAFSVANSDGVTIYYKWANEEKTEVAVSYEYYHSLYGYETNYTKSVVIPESVVYEGNTYNVTSIGDHAFYRCEGLTSVTIPNSVISIGANAFYGCSGLTSVIIPNNVTSIGVSAFEGCRGLTSVTIPNSVTSIENSAFRNCYGLTSVTIPNSVISIGGGAFASCSGLSSVTIPNNVTSIGNSAFASCSGLSSVTIPNSVTSIGETVFRYCRNLTSVIIGSGVTSIGDLAFGDTNLKKVIWLTNTPPSGYKNVSGTIHYVSNDQYSFYNQVKYQFLSSYFEVDGIRYVPVSPSERTCDAIDCVYDESAANTKIASTVEYKGVAMNVKNLKPYLAYSNKYIKTLTVDLDGELPNYALANCSNMQSAALGQKVKAIGSYAFQGCSSIEAIDIPDIMTVLNERTFSGCTSLKEIKIKPQLTNIYNYVFENCTNLKKVTIDDSENTLTLGSNGNSPIFSSCPLDYVYIGRDINYSTGSNTGYSPFYRNTSLREVKITDKETEISENEFYGCTNLQKITIGDGVTTIGKRAFSGCSSLLYFAFGTQVADIREEAFSDCAAMVEVISKAQNPPVCGSQALDDINKFECKLYVPDGCMTVYETADQWKDFFFKDEGEGTASQGESGEQIVNKCETPTISFDGDKLSFACATEGVAFHYTISHSDVKSGISSKAVDLAQTYNITVYASKDGYNDSEVAKATLKASNSVLIGDVDGDGIVNVADHVKLSDIILNK